LLHQLAGDQLVDRLRPKQHKPKKEGYTNADEDLL
jgi:hypothetical protein